MRYGLRTLLILVTALGLGLGALAAPTAFMSGLVFGGTLLATASCLLVAICRRDKCRQDKARTLAIGYLVFSLLYWLCIFVFEGKLALQFNDQERMPTTRAIKWVYQQYHGKKMIPVTGPPGYAGPPMVMAQFPYPRFMEVSQCVAAYLFGVVGALMAVAISGPPLSIGHDPERQRPVT